MSLAPPDLLRFAYLSLKGNPVRSLLSTLGVFMGVFAVSATLEARNLGQAFLSQQLSQREAPQARIFYQRWLPNADKDFRLRDENVDFLRQHLSGWQAIGSLRGGFWDQTVQFEGQESSADVRPVSLAYLETTGRQLLDGRFFTPADFEKYRAVAVIDEWLANELFGDAPAIGQLIYVGSSSYLVIGVIETILEPWEEEPSGLVLISMTMHTALTGIDTIRIISIRPQRVEDLEMVAEEAAKLLSQDNPGKEFSFWSNIDDIAEQRQILQTVSLILLALGGIALTVGGVGIANITIASTVERTSEIGLRRAIGATRQEILVQFVLEAVMISCVGGVVAIATTQSIAFAVAQTFELPYQINLGTSVMALGSAVVVGVGSSFIPALQASQLDPVNALRT